MKSRGILIASGILGAAGILIGAFGAHALPNILSDLSPEDLEIRKAWLETGVTYHMYHVVALFALGITGVRTTESPSPSFGGSAIAWIVGIAIFSGCLYAMALTGVRVLGAIVPIGGVAFVVGWVMILVAALRSQN